MRVASALLIAVLLSTCAISGTFAKYVTTASGSDNARVAKWGITMSNGEDSFKSAYGASVLAYDNDTDTLVAPGTDGSTTYQVSGKPETDYIITFEDTICNHDVFLGKGDYTYTGVNVDYLGMNATLGDSDFYYPLEWRVTIETNLGDVDNTNGWVKNESRIFAKLEDAMTALANAKVTFKATEACDMIVRIEWEWDFDGASGAFVDPTYTSNDVYDTILGDLAARDGGASTNLTATNATYDLDVDFTVKMKATQLD